MLRMLAGSPLSRQIIHSLLSRGYRLTSDHCPFNSSPLPFPDLPHYSSPTTPSTYCWALALIQYLQAADSNLHITPPFPATSVNTLISHTPIHSLYSASRDCPLTDVYDFEEASYHIYVLCRRTLLLPTPRCYLQIAQSHHTIPSSLHPVSS